MAMSGYLGKRVGSHTTNSSLSSAVTLTPPTDGNYIQLQCFGQNIRYTLDGTTPTATTGFQLAVNSTIVLDIGADTVLKIIEETASASVQYQWFGQHRDTGA